VPPGERRQVAVLFADLSGYTRLSSSLDPEDVHHLLGRYFDVVDALVKSHGGNVDKHIGDAVMAVFGAPVAHGNDAERAVRVACEIHRALERLSIETGRTLRAHAGIAAGEVVAAGTGSNVHTEYTVIGDAVNLASRLDGLARAGETLVSDDFYRQVWARVEAEDRGPERVKGLAEPVRVWRIIGVHDHEAEVLPLCGRVAERRQFEGILEAAISLGAGSSVCLRGEPGIGKTRLVQQFIRTARERGLACVRGHVLDFGTGRGRGAIAALTAGLLAVARDDDGAVRPGDLQDHSTNADGDPTTEVFVRDLLELPQRDEARPIFEGMDVQTRRRGRSDTLRALAGQAARRRPIVLVAEDVHWADADTLELLAALARAVAGSRAVLVMTSRVQGDPLDRPWRASLGTARLATVDLGPLAPDDARRLAASMPIEDERLVDQCVQRAAGNPLFLVQLLHSAREGGALPASIQSLVLARIDGLAAADKAAVQAAAVIGQRFPITLLRHLLEDETYGCEGLLKVELVRRDGDELLFCHALVCDGAYASLLHRRKRELHLAAARWYRDRDVRLWAQHLDRAEDPGACAATLHAARETASDLRFDVALTLAERALVLAGEGPLQQAAAVLRGELLRELGHNAEAVTAFELARDAASDEISRCRAWLDIASAHRFLGNIAPALDALEAAQPLAERNDLTRDRARLHYLRGNLQFARGDVVACGEEHQRALGLARAAGCEESEAQALSGIGDAFYATGRMRSAGKAFQRCVELCERPGLLRFSIMNRAMIGWCDFWCGNTTRAMALLRESSDLASRLGHVNAQVMTAESLGVALIWLGDYDEAEIVNLRGMELARAAGARRYEVVIRCLLAIIAISRGRPEQARHTIADSLQELRDMGAEAFAGPLVQSVLAQATNDPVERDRLLADGGASLERGALSHCHLWFYPEAMRVRLQDGRWEEVDRYANALETFVSAEPLAWASHHVALGHALARHGRGERSEALRRERERLADEARRFGYVRTLRDLAQAEAR